MSMVDLIPMPKGGVHMKDEESFKGIKGGHIYLGDSGMVYHPKGGRTHPKNVLFDVMEHDMMCGYPGLDHIIQMGLTPLAGAKK